MTHAKHFGYGLNKSNYLASKSASTLAESYALAMEYKITMDEYNVKGTTTVHDNIKANREYDYKNLQKENALYFSGWIGLWDPNYSLGVASNFTSSYTPYLIDMIDNSNQLYQTSSDINDDLTGITIAQIDAALAYYPMSPYNVNLHIKSSNNFNYANGNKINYLYNIYFANK